MRKILVTNDDGIMSPDLLKLASAATEFGKVYVVAPDTQRSAYSHRYTYAGTFGLRKTDIAPGIEAWSCTGSPADCVKVGHMKLIEGGADLVLSGINFGSNISADVQYSATVAAVLEAAFLGIHAIAFSQGTGGHSDIVDRYLKELIGELIDSPLGRNEAWNVNFPDCPLSECRGIMRGCSVSYDDFYNDTYELTELPDGTIEARHIPDRLWKASEGTDLHAIAGRYISVGKVRNLS